MSNNGEVKVIGRTFSRGEQQWRINADESWSVMMYGSFRPGQVGLHWEWVHIDTSKVPQELLDLVKDL